MAWKIRSLWKFSDKKTKPSILKGTLPFPQMRSKVNFFNMSFWFELFTDKAYSFDLTFISFWMWIAPHEISRARERR